MDVMELAQKIISLLSSEKGESLASIISNFLDDDTAQKLTSSVSDGDENAIVEILEKLAGENSELIEYIKTAVDMVEKEDLSIDNISEMVQKIAGDKIKDLLGGFGKFF
ncbi:MAG: hypothetical protein GXO21_08740 [Aquificae bacterium]|nr:hypothetical protein [Aquificota bacterium]